MEMKALIAESNCEESDSMVIALNMCFPNFELMTANTSQQCLDIVKNKCLDIVILGDLAETSSFDVIRQIRDYSEVPVMVLSHISEESGMAKAFEMGADGYMVKPFHQLELMARIRSLIRRGKAK
jgi:DNA-binding response OmpR family regulator